MPPEPVNFESAFDSLTSFGLEQIGMNPEFVADYVNWEGLRNRFDFKGVDREAGTKLLDLSKTMAAKYALEGVTKVADSALTIAAAGLGLTGVGWAGMVGTVAAKEIMDWGESYFESWMGWGDIDKPKKGHWVLVDEGTRRRRAMGGEFEDQEIDEETQLYADLRNRPTPEMAPKSDLVRVMTLAYTIGDVEDGRIKVVDEHMDVRHPNISKVAQLSAKMEAELDNSPDAQRMKDIAEHHHEGLHKPLDDKVHSRIGEQVKIDGDRWTVVEGTSFKQVVAERNGKRVIRAWEEVEPTWNTGHIATTHRTVACPATNDHRRLGRKEGDDLCVGDSHDFMQAGGFGVGSYAWNGNELVCVVATRGKDEVRAWSAYDRKQKDLDVHDLSRVEENLLGKGDFGRFARACAEGDSDAADEYLPSKSFEGYTSPFQRGSFTRDVEAKPRRGRKETGAPFKGLDEDYSFDTPGLALRKDKDRERYDKEAALYESQRPEAPPEWDQMSWGARSGVPPYRPAFPSAESSGTNFVPIILGGALVAFALTR